MGKVMKDLMDEASALYGMAAAEQATGPTKVAFDVATGNTVVTFKDGSLLSFPTRTLKGLTEATDAELAEVELMGADGLHWETLDTDYHISTIMAGLVGFSNLMAHLAARAGRVSSAAKADAARMNGTKGGRPKKKAV